MRRSTQRDRHGTATRGSAARQGIVRSAAVAAAEALESRRLFATVTWTGATDGNWSNTANWTDDASTHRVPTANDDVVINPAGTLTVSVDGAFAARSLTLAGDDTLSLFNTSLTLGAASQIKQLVLGGSGTVFANAALALSGSTTMNNNAVLGGSGVITNSGTLTITSTGTAVQTELVDSGTINVNDGNWLVTSGPTGKVRVTSGGAINATSATLVRSSGGLGVFVEAGGTYNAIGGGNANGGLSIDGGTLKSTFLANHGINFGFNGPTTLHNATLNADAGTTIFLNGDATDTLSGDIVGTGAGSITADGSTKLNLIADAKINFADNQFGLNNSATFTGNFTLTNNGSITFRGIHSVTASVVNRGTIRTSVQTTFDNATAGLDVKSGGVVRGSGTIAGAATGSGILFESGSKLLSDSGISLGGTNLTFDGATLETTAPGGISFTGTATLKDAVINSPANLVLFQPTSTTTLSGTLTGTGAARSIRFGSNEANFVVASGGATLNLAAGQILFANADISGPGTLTLAGTSMAYIGATPTLRTELAVAGLLNFTDGGAAGMTLSGPAALLHVLNGGTAYFTSNDVMPGVGGANSPIGVKIDAGGLLTREGSFGGLNIAVPLDNLGTLRTLGRTLQISGPIAQLVGTPGNTTLTGGTWVQSSVSNFDWQGKTINTLGAAATVQVGFGNFGFPAADTIGAVQGTLHLTEGKDIVLGSALGNSGVIILDPGTSLSAGSYMQTAAGTIEHQISGTDSDHIGRLLVSGAATLAGTAKVTLGTGYAPTINDTFQLETFASHNGQFSVVQGLGGANGVAFEAVYTATDLHLNAIGGGAADLGVTSITPPSAGVAGQNVTLSYTVTNNGGPTAAGSWVDTIYLSKDGNLDGRDVILGQVAHTGVLGAGASYTANPTLPLVGILPGTYHLVVVTDSRGQVADTNRVNNAVASVGTVSVTLPALTPGVAFNGTIKAGQNLYYQVTLPAGKTPTFTFAGAVNGAAEIFQSLGRVPTLADFDSGAFNALSTVQRVAGSTTAAATYFILLRGRENAGNGVSFSLLAQGSGFDLVSSSVTTGSSGGSVTTTLSGSQFTPATTFSLTRSGVTRVAGNVQFIDSQHASATFDLSGLTNGTYNLVATDGASTDTLAGAFTVSTGLPAGQLQYRLSGPSAVRPPYANSGVTITYSNVGKTDINAPVFELMATNARVRLSRDGNFLPATFSSADNKPLNVYELLGVSGGLAGVLSPGETGSITVYFEPIDASPHAKSNFELLAPDTTADAQPMAYNRLSTQFRPAGIADDAWTAILNNFKADAGATFGGYRAMLVNNANYLGQFETVSPDVSGLIQFELEKSNLFGELSNRYGLGSYGRGSVGPYSTRAIADEDGNVTVTDGQRLRFFAKNGSGYSGFNGDGATLTRSGSTYTLTERNKAKTVFRSDGQIDYRQDPNGNRLTMVYNGSGQLTSVTNSRTGDVVTYAYNAAGRIISMTDPVGRVTTYGYDAANQHLTSITSSLGTITRTYNADHSLASVTGVDGITTTYAYDARGRQTSRTVGSGNGAYKVMTTYGGPGQISVNDGVGGPTTFYLTHGGKPARVVDSLGHTTGYQYDNLGTLAKLTDAIGLSASTSTVGGSLTVSSSDRSTTQLDYDASNDRVTAITGPGGDEIAIEYDSRGNRTRTVLPDGSNEKLEFDGTGRVTASTDANGVRSTYTYNNKNQVTSRTYSTGETVSYTYDAHRNLLTATGPGGTTTYSYDAVDRLTGVTYPNGKSVTATYDSAGRRATVSDNAGYTARYGYDALGRLSAVRDTANTLIVAYTYDAASRIALETRGNGGTVAYAYDAVGQIISITHRDAANAIIEKFTYTRDALGRIITATSNAGTTSYAYDAVGQLTGVSLPGGRTITYGYDIEGNRTQLTDSAAGTTNYSVNVGDQYTAAGGETFTYDTAGRLLTRTQSGVTTTYTYTYAGLLAGESSPGNVVTYQYDASGARIGKTVNGLHTDYAVDPAGLGTVFGEYTGGTSANYVNALGITARSSGGSNTYYHFDATGNTAYMSGTGGAPVQSYSYLPFGEIAAQSGSVAQPFTFGGRVGVQASGSGLFDMRSRTYDARTGRFVSRDPITTDGGDTNLYRYVGNDPVNRVDPSGLMFEPAVQAALESFNEFGAPLLNYTAEGIAGLSDAALAWTARFAAGEAAYASQLAATIEAGIGGAIDTVLEGGSGIVSDVIAEGLGAHATNVELVQAEIARRAAAAEAAEAAAAVTPAASTLAATAAAGPGVFLAAAYAIDGGELLFESSPFARLAQTPPQDVLGPNSTRARQPRDGASELFNDLYRLARDRGLSDADAIREAIEFLRRRNIQDPVYNPNPQRLDSENVRPNDPNNILGPAGPLADGLPDTIAPGQTRFDGFVTAKPYDYRIEFENKSTANAPAQVVIVTQTLDNDLDLTTFKFTAFGFGDYLVNVPADAICSSYSTVVDATTKLGVKVKIDASLNLATRLLTVVYTSLDPATNDVPIDPLAGFLPPNVADPEGDGFLTYLVSPKAAVANGTRLDAKATIVFDTEDPIDTPAVHNTVDTAAPVSKVNALAASSASPVSLTWSGTDTGGSGIAGYDIYVSDNNGAYALLLDDTPLTAYSFVGTAGHTYRFYSVATDRVGFTEATPNTPDAVTTVTGGGGGQTGSISGVLWNDTDNDGVFDANESPSGVRQVFLDTNANGKLDSGEKSVMSDSKGKYTFANLPAGTYNVSRVFPSGYHFSNSPIDDLAVTLATGQNLAGVNIGTTNRPRVTPPPGGGASISGTLFNDDDKDGLFDAKEKPTGARQVFLDTNGNGKLDSGEKGVMSDSQGRYTFGNLAAGNYKVSRVFPSGYRLSNNTLGYVAVTVAANGKVTGVNLGTRTK